VRPGRRAAGRPGDLADAVDLADAISPPLIYPAAGRQTASIQEAAAAEPAAAELAAA
jgi:hypothetical protein